MADVVAKLLWLGARAELLPCSCAGIRPGLRPAMVRGILQITAVSSPEGRIGLMASGPLRVQFVLCAPFQQLFRLSLLSTAYVRQHARGGQTPHGLY